MKKVTVDELNRLDNSINKLHIGEPGNKVKGKMNSMYKVSVDGEELTPANSTCVRKNNHLIVEKDGEMIVDIDCGEESRAALAVNYSPEGWINFETSAGHSGATEIISATTGGSESVSGVPMLSSAIGGLGLATAAIATSLGGGSDSTTDHTANTPSTPTTPPVLAPASDSGTLGDNLTNHSTPTLTGAVGSVEGNSIVKVYDGATLMGSTTAAADGSWSYIPAALSEGLHVITYTQTDEAGNESRPGTALNLTIDTTAPGAPTIGAVTDDQGSVTGTVVSGDTTDDTQLVV